MKQFYISALLFIGIAISQPLYSQFNYVQSLQDDSDGGTVPCVENVTGLDVSPDGKYLYTGTYQGLDGLGAFSIDPNTAQMTFLFHYQDGVDAGFINGCEAPEISPDGKHLYVPAVTDDAVTVFSIDAATGLLTYVEEKRDGIGGVDGLNGAKGVAISPDNNHVYVCGSQTGDDAIAVFSRNTTTGALTYVEVEKHGIGGVVMDNPRDLIVSPDGLHVYAVANSSDVVTKFSRNSGSGALTYLGTESNIYTDGVQDIDISPDGNYVYVAGTGTSDAISVWTRNAGTGNLTYASNVRDDAQGGSLMNLDWPHAVEVSDDGNYVLVGTSVDNSVLLFNRNSGTGALTLAQEFLTGTGSIPTWALGNVRDVGWGPNSDMFFAGSYNEYVNSFAITSLDVEMDDFWGVRNESDVDLYWSTLSEMDNDHFEIQRSKDGKHFHSIGEVQAHGNTAIGHEYSFGDLESLSQNQYYRIKIVAIEGVESYTKTIKVNSLGKIDYSVFPNPVTNELKILTPMNNGVMKVELYDVNGRLYQFELEDGMKYKQISTKELAPGVYFIKIRSNDQVFESKIIKN